MKKLFLFVIIPLLIIGGAVGFAYYYFGPERVFDVLDTVFTSPDAEKDQKKFFYSSGQYSAELISETGESRLVSIEVIIELSDENSVRRASVLDPIIKDTVLQYINGLRPVDFLGSQGVVMIKAELFYRIKRSLAPLEIKSVLIQNITFSG